MLSYAVLPGVLTRGACPRRGREPGSSCSAGSAPWLPRTRLIALRAGYPTCTLGGVDETKFPAEYHWPSDIPDNLDWSSIDGAVEVCLTYLRA